MKRKSRYLILVFLALALAAGYFAYARKTFKPGIVSITLPGAGYSASEQRQRPKNPAEIEARDQASHPEDLAGEIKEEIPAEAKNSQPAEKNNEKIKETEKKASNISVANKLVSWGYQKSSGRMIDTIIIHSSYDALGQDPYDLDGLIKEYKIYGVAPHYLIDREGKIYKLVEEKNIAYHAGESRVPDGRTNVNNFSIGVELMNEEETKFTGEQYAALNKLLKDIKSRYDIKYTLGHSQIAPGRKTDPWNFDWDKL